MKTVLTILALVLAMPGEAQQAVSIPGTEVRTLHSEVIGQEYRLLVNLPGGYDAGRAEPYPVIYLLDAQWDFPLLHAIYGEQYYDGFLPEAVIIGLTWGGDGADPNVLRVRDFTPTDVEGDGRAGGADAFLRFFAEELFPWAEKEYRVGDRRTLMGSSLGGLFTLYALFNRPQLFQNYVPSSPAVTWDNGALYHSAERYVSRPENPPARMFLPVAELESLHRPVMEFAAMLGRHPLPHLEWQVFTVEGAGHSGVKAEGNTRGLQYVFARQDLQLTDEQLNAYAGLYDSGQGERLEIWVQDGKLLGRAAAGEPAYQWRVDTPDHLYVAGEFARLRVTFGPNGKVSGFTLLRYGRETPFQRSVDRVN